MNNNNTHSIMTPAKINLSLDVVGERADGYHLLETIMQSIALYDKITVSISEPSDQNTGKIDISALNPTFPCDSRNTCHKAAALFSKAFQPYSLDAVHGAGSSPKNVRIMIDKNIPLAAGLGGGSADAAAVLISLNELSGSPFTLAKLMQMGAVIGADVPFCLIGGTALCKGIGEIIEPLPPLESFPVVIVKANFGVSTQWAFRKLRMDNIGKRPNTPFVVRDIEEKDIEGLFTDTSNVLESVTVQEYPVIDAIKRALKELGAIGSLMSGSGPSVFGFFETREMASEAAKQLRKISRFEACFIQDTYTSASGPVETDEEQL